MQEQQRWTSASALEVHPHGATGISVSTRQSASAQPPALRLDGYGFAACGRRTRATRGEQGLDPLAGGRLAPGGGRREVDLLLTPVGLVQQAPQANHADV